LRRRPVWCVRLFTAWFPHVLQEVLSGARRGDSVTLPSLLRITVLLPAPTARAQGVDGSPPTSTCDPNIRTEDARAVLRHNKRLGSRRSHSAASSVTRDTSTSPKTSTSFDSSL